MGELNGKTVVILVDEIYNDLEFWYPKFRMEEAGAKVLVAASKANEVYKSKYGMPAKSDMAYGDVKIEDIDAIIVPGGYAPDRIRRDVSALKLVSQAFNKGLVVAHICHAGWVLISAGILNGRTTTSYVAIRDDIVNAGATWVDEAVVVDKNLISSRTPDDLPVFCKAIIDNLK